MLARVFSIIRRFFLNPFFGFIEGHSHLSLDQLKSINQLIGVENPDVGSRFEDAFAKIIGDGECVSYAAARMGFYDLMRLLGIGKGDEVILLGATCSVMPIAVLRVGATPIYSDIDQQTYGSSFSSIKSCLTASTKLIVAQHSFGIPCEIDRIQSLAQEWSTFLLEDCALTLGSKLNGVVVGNFGDAALFSTDHSKPLNTLTGGMIYTKDKQLAYALRNSRNQCGELPIRMQHALWKRLKVERWFCNSKNYGKFGLVEIYDVLGDKFFGLATPYLVNNIEITRHTQQYPYPAKLPGFLPELGIYEVEKWKLSADSRKQLLKLMISKFRRGRLKPYLPASYTDTSKEIVPLRFVWHEPSGAERRHTIGRFVHVDWTWFMKPIVATKEPLDYFGYHIGACPVSEKVGPNMVNIPCNINSDEHMDLLDKIEKFTV